MIYAIRRRGNRRTLVELKSPKELREKASYGFFPATRSEAHAWVKAGKEHETGLHIDHGKLLYASAE